MTKRIALSLIALIASSVLGLAACARSEAQAPAQPAAAAPAAPAAPAPAAETATFQVPGLDAELVGKLTAALGSRPGVVSARADQAGGTYAVTFTPGQTNPQELLKALQGIKAEIGIKGVAGATREEAPPPGHNCGGCPHRNTCAKGH
jgi:hypothetical protein